MASYRPKSLDELNNLYGKAVSAEKAIKKGTSLLGEDALSITSEEKAEAPAALRTPAEPKVESVSPDIDAFICQFASEEGRPVPLSKLTPPTAALQNSNQSAAQPKEEGITGLMDDYANVMTGAYDDDDDDEPKKNLFKQRRGKKKASKEITAENYEQPEQVESEPDSFYPPADDAAFHAGASLFENDSAAYENVSSYRSPQGEIPDGADDEVGDEPYDRENVEQNDFEFGDIGAAPKLSGGKRAAKVLMIFLLVLILLATAATGACVLNVNSGNEIGGYRIYTVDSADVKSGITADDLVFCKSADVYQKDENVVYYDTAGKRAVGKIILANGNDTYNINISDVQKERIEGSVQKSIASFGKLAKTVSDSFLMLLIALVAIAIVITLILCFAFKPKAVAAKTPAYDETDDSGRQLSKQSENEQDEHGENELFDGIE